MPADQDQLSRVTDEQTGALYRPASSSDDRHGLRFIDVGGVRAIVRAAVGLPLGRRMIIHGTAARARRPVTVSRARVDETALLG
jgi:hypothetical protein